LSPDIGDIKGLAFSPSGKSIALLGSEAAVLSDIEGAIRWKVAETNFASPDSGFVSFSHNGDRVLLSLGGKSDGDEVGVFNAQTGRPINKFSVLRGYFVRSVALSPDGQRLVDGNNDWDHNVGIWDVKTGKQLLDLKGHSRGVVAVAYSPDGKQVLTGGLDGTARLWNATTGAQQRVFRPDSASAVASVAFSPDGSKAFTGHENGTIVIWQATTGAQIATQVASPDGEWAVITNDGFFDASPKGSQLLYAVNGLDVITIEQLFQRLYRPDLVREKFAGDPQSKVRTAAASLDLTKLVASGLAPQVRISSPTDGARARQEQVTVQVEVQDRGGGIGRVEWRVNGVTLGVEHSDQGLPFGGKSRLQQDLQLENGDNNIEVVVYNAKNLVASAAARAVVRWDGSGPRVAPRLFVVAVGVNEYLDARLNLNFATADAKSIATGLQRASHDLFQTINVVTALDGDVTRDRLEAIFTTLGTQIMPSDVFILFMGGHGRTLDGRYYFLPQDFRYRDENSIRSKAIDQERLQSWLAKIAAKKSVLIFDTCGSGSLTDGLFATRSDEYLVAVEQLTHAIGRTVLSASTAYQQAIEGYHDHGLFTYAVLEGLGRASANDDGLITVLGLHDYVMQRVPQLSAQLYGRRQEPTADFRGTSFPLARPTNVLGDADTTPLPVSTIATHVIVERAQVYATPEGVALVRMLEPGTLVTELFVDGDWALVAKDGKQIGYVTKSSLARIQ
jgi:WD40 repeat protein